MAPAAGNPSIRNWCLNQVMQLECNRRFQWGFTTPEAGVTDSHWNKMTCLDVKEFDPWYLKGYINPVIRELLDHGYYVVFSGVDDYYVEGKSWYKERHFDHDGVICGYDQEDKTYCIYAYDSNWICQKFWTSQKGFNRGREVVKEKGGYQALFGIKARNSIVEFSPETVLQKLGEYLDSSMWKYPPEEEGKVYGIVVQEYLAKYVGRLYDGAIPYPHMDRRVFRIVWEHKKGMLERIRCLEEALGWEPEFSREYEPLVREADTMRMLYASHHMHRRDSVLPIIQKKMWMIREKEEELLTKIVKKGTR